MLSREVLRLPAVLACLALFLTGSNYCLIGAWSGEARMACTVVSPDPAAGSGCHPPVPSTGSEGDGRGATSACCPDPVLAPTGPSLDGTDRLAASPAGMLLFATDADLPPRPEAWHGRRALPDGHPPTRLACAPLSARAPPLA